MATKLTTISVRKDADILLVHDIALKLARQSGFTPSEQVGFAAAVVEDCSINEKEGEHVSFSIYKRDENRHFLQAALQKKAKTIEKEMPASVDPQNISPNISIHEPIQDGMVDRFKDMQQFTFAISHDLKNSLTKLKLAVTLMQDEKLSPNLQSYIQIIDRSSHRLEHTMESLNQIISLGHTSSEVVKKIMPAEIFADVMEDFSLLLQQANATVTVDFSSLNKFNYIEIYLRSIFTNMLSNSIKYAAPGRQLEISVTGYKNGGNVIFIFRDNGQGMDLEKIGDKLFQPFTRFSGNADGTGIGLYLVKSMVERNGGSIEVESKPDTGAGFVFRLKEYDTK